MAVLTRLKNFVSLLRSGSKSNEEEKEDVELNATPVQGQVILNEEQVALEQAAKEAEEQKEMTVEEQLESLKITHQFPYKAVKKIVKERDMDYFRDLYSTEEGWRQEVTEDTSYLYDLLKSIAPENLKDVTKDQPIVITDTTNNDVIVNDGEWKVVTNVNGRGLNRWATL